MKWLIVSTGLLLATLTGMIALSSATRPPVLRSIHDVAASVDRSDLPPISRFPARDGVQLAYRAYPGSAEKVAILCHGSSASSRAMHAVGKTLSQNGMTTFALDIRGHGDSGVRGDIGYVGQLEDDMQDFVAFVRKTYPRASLTLIGHSSGGGFALRVAGSPISTLFTRYLLLAPYLSHEASLSKPENGGWVNAAIPRIIGLAVLHRLGIDWFAKLPVLAFAIPKEAEDILTGTYSYRLFANYRPHLDYLMDIRRGSAPITVLIGQDDELFHANEYVQTLTPVSERVRVVVLLHIGHMAIVSDPAALQALVDNL